MSLLLRNLLFHKSKATQFTGDKQVWNFATECAQLSKAKGEKHLSERVAQVVASSKKLTTTQTDKMDMLLRAFMQCGETHRIIELFSWDEAIKKFY